MRLAATEYIRPTSVEDALDRVVRHDGRSRARRRADADQRPQASGGGRRAAGRRQPARGTSRHRDRGGRVGADRRGDDLPRAGSLRGAPRRRTGGRTRRRGDRRSAGPGARNDRRQRVLRRSGVQLPAAPRRARRRARDQGAGGHAHRPRLGVLPRDVPHRSRSRRAADEHHASARSRRRGRLRVAAARRRLVGPRPRRGGGSRQRDGDGRPRRPRLCRSDTGARTRHRVGADRRSRQRGGGQRRPRRWRPRDSTRPPTRTPPAPTAARWRRSWPSGRC